MFLHFVFPFSALKKFGCVQCLAFAFVMLLPIAHPAFHPVSMVSPLNVSQFTLDLAGHPDRQAVAYVLNGLQHGFRLGFQPARKLKPARKNKPSAFQNPKVIDDYLATEVARGRVAGPFPSPPLPNLQVSSFGVIPKKGQPGKWRLIVDLSSPHGSSVNDGIDADEFSMHYIHLDQIINMIAKHGPGALMAKFDVEAAYRNIAVHPDDRYLLGMKWRGQFFVDLALPFGLRSVPYIFNSVADLVEWILKNKYRVIDLMHYLDDFITAGPADSLQCSHNLQTSLAICRSLGLPLHPNKCIGPSTRLVVLGIELDSLDQTARLPAEKLMALKELIQSWRTRRWCNRRQLESLIGHLHHAAKVVWPGRTFLRRMLDLLCCFRTRDHPIRLSSEFRLDLQWWHDFLTSWHGVSLWLFPGMSAPTDVEVTSDAAGSWASGHVTIMNGSVVPGYRPRLTSPLLTRNCFLWWWLLTYGDLSGLGDTFCFGQIMRLLYTYCLPGHRRFHALCIFSVIYFLLLLALTLLSLHSISPAYITILLMLFPAFIGRTSGAWHPQHNLTQFQSLLNSGSS